MTQTRSWIVSIVIGAAFALVLDFGFLNLTSRPALDQALLSLFSFLSCILVAKFSFDARPAIGDWIRSIDFSNLPRAALDAARAHWAALLLAFLFFAVYARIGLRLNPSSIPITDNLLQADNSSWMARMAGPSGGQMEMRGPHPYAYFIFRPLGLLLNFFTHSPALSAILMTAFAGGLCVFLAWRFIELRTGSSVYAFLIASLLGLSTAQLFFGSVIETYIFSAATLIAFYLLLGRQPNSMLALVAAALLTFGITFTNFAQEMVGFAVSRPRLNAIIRFAALTLTFAVALSLVHAAVYPTSRLFFLPSTALREQQYGVSFFHDARWKQIGRIVLMMRTILLYTVIAPKPYVFLADVGGTFPRFNFFKIVPGTYSFSAYTGLGTILVFAWAALLFTAGAYFLWSTVRSRRVDVKLAFALCLLFNFLLHINYGYEPFLYSPDWAFALIFFVALSLAPLAANRFFQAGLLVFISLLAVNQVFFIKFIFDTIAPYLGQ